MKQMEQLRKDLLIKNEENADLKREIQKLRSENSLKDTKIRELTIRLDASRYASSSKAQDIDFGNSSDLSMISSNDERVSLVQRRDSRGSLRMTGLS